MRRVLWLVLLLLYLNVSNVVTAKKCLVVCPPKAIICNGPNIVPFIINANCTTCGACITACPVKAISIIN